MPGRVSCHFGRRIVRVLPPLKSQPQGFQGWGCWVDEFGFCSGFPRLNPLIPVGVPIECPACQWLCVPFASLPLCCAPCLLFACAQVLSSSSSPRRAIAVLVHFGGSGSGWGWGWVGASVLHSSVALACCTCVCAASALRSPPFPNPPVVHLFFALCPPALPSMAEEFLPYVHTMRRWRCCWRRGCVAASGCSCFLATLGSVCGPLQCRAPRP